MTDRTPLTPGQIVANRIEVDRVLGSGGFSAVYLAHNINVPEMRYALKVLEINDESAQSQDRFVQEARIMASLEAPTIAAVKDFGHLDDGRPFLLLEFVDAPDLARLMNHFGALSASAITRVTRDVLDALVRVHAAGMIHRDIKPENILVDLSSKTAHVARLTDFGIAKVLDDATSPIGGGVRTDDGAVLCTPSYAAPEVLCGNPEFQSDLFSLGLTVASMIVGGPVIEARSLKEVFGLYVSPDDFTFADIVSQHALYPLVQRSTKKRHWDRYGSAKEMLDHLNELSATLPKFAPRGASASLPSLADPIAATEPARATPGRLSTGLSAVATLPLDAIMGPRE